MRKEYIIFAILALCLSITGIALSQGDINKYPSCKYCGMDREKFAHSRIFIQYQNGTTEGACSLHCAAIEFALNIDKTPLSITVGNYNTKNLIDAEKAFWIIGGSKMGVMTKRAKWAFENKEDAERFTRENGGELAKFEQAIQAAYQDMYEDTKMIRDRRKMRKMDKEPTK